MPAGCTSRDNEARLWNGAFAVADGSTNEARLTKQCAMIAVFGATGKMGSAVAEELRRRGVEVRAVVRNPERAPKLKELGCTLAVADLLNPDAVREALKGAEGAFVIVPLRPRAEDVLGEAAAMVDSLAAGLTSANPKRVIAISDYGAQVPQGTGITVLFHRLEEKLRALPLQIAFLRSAEHMQNQARQLKSARDRGEFFSLHHPIEKLFPCVSSPDVGLVAADLLASTDPLPKVLHVEGPKRYSAVEVAQIYSKVLGREVKPRALNRASWIPSLEAAGIGPSYAALVAELQDAHNAGVIEVEKDGAIRRGPTALETVLSEVVKR
jgi:NAD(P)H dehydrogenase (quinone)